MPHADLVIRGQRVAWPEKFAEDSLPFADPKQLQSGQVQPKRPVTIAPASIHITRGVITAIAHYDDVPDGCPVESADQSVIVMPGLVDTHVHVNEPGRAEWEGFAT